MSFHLALSGSQKASPLHSGGAAGSVRGRLLGEPNKSQRHKGPSQAELGSRTQERGGGLGEAGANLHLLWQAAMSMLAGIQLQPRGMQV